MDFNKDVLFNREFRTKFMANPHKYLKELNSTSLEGMEIKIVENKKGVLYFIVPNQIDNDDLSNISAAVVTSGGTSTAGTLGTASTASSVSSTFGSVSCALSVGTSGTVQLQK